MHSLNLSRRRGRVRIIHAPTGAFVVLCKGWWDTVLAALSPYVVALPLVNRGVVKGVVELAAHTVAFVQPRSDQPSTTALLSGNALPCATAHSLELEQRLSN